MHCKCIKADDEIQYLQVGCHKWPLKYDCFRFVFHALSGVSPGLIRFPLTYMEILTALTAFGLNRAVLFNTNTCV